MPSNKTDSNAKRGERAHKSSPTDRSLENKTVGRGARLGGVRKIGEPMFQQPVVEKPNDDKGPETKAD